MESLSKRMRLAYVPQNFKVLSENKEKITILRPHPSFSTDTDTSNLIKIPHKDIISSSSQKPLTTLNSREYCLVNLEDKKFCVLSIRMIKSQKNSAISVDKTYNIMFGNKIMRGTVKHIGHKFDCFNRMKRLQINAEKDENLEKPVLNDMSNELTKKDEVIKKKDNEINKLNQSIEKYKRIIDKENLHTMKKFCSDILELCENEKDLVSEPQKVTKDNLVCLTDNYPNELVSFSTKLTLEETLKSSELSSVAFRKILTVVFPDIFLWAENCRKTMVEKYPERIMACFDFVQKKFPDFTYNMACSIMTKISSNSRTRLKHLGYSIVSKYDTISQTSTHEIFKNNANNSKKAMDNQSRKNN